jgi:hypothetical protein
MADKFVPENLEGCFTFDRITKNTSSHGYCWIRTGGMESRYMTKTHMEDLLKRAVIDKGKVRGKWTTKSQGGVKSLVLVESYPIDCDKCENKIQCALRGDNRE